MHERRIQTHVHTHLRMGMRRVAGAVCDDGRVRRDGLRERPRAARMQSPIAMTQPEFSRILLLGDVGALLMYSLGLSTSRTLGLAGPDFDAASDLTSFLVESNMNLTVQYIQIEELSAIAMALAWLVGAALSGGLRYAWFACVLTLTV